MPTARICITLRRLVLLSAILGTSAQAAGPAALPPVRDDIAQRALACMACHGQRAEAEKSAIFPNIAGKPTGYLYHQLINFREGRRRYPVMNALVANLSDAYLLEMAAYFSAMQFAHAPARLTPAATGTKERGRQLIMQGDPARQIPACVACHGQALTGAAPAIPGLLGLPQAYLNAQLGAWKLGSRRATAPDCMSKVSQQLSPTDIEAVTAWLSSQPMPAGPIPTAPAGATLPLPCGSVSQ